jgi:hypothetical protein
VSTRKRVSRREFFTYSACTSPRGDVSLICNNTPVRLACIHPLIVDPLVKSSCPAVLTV